MRSRICEEKTIAFPPPLFFLLLGKHCFFLDLASRLGTRNLASAPPLPPCITVLLVAYLSKYLGGSWPRHVAVLSPTRLLCVSFQ